jgi:CYTH domain-containing protein
MNEGPKYSILEIERRWTVSRTDLPDLDESTKSTIRDEYLPGSRLRLRLIRDDSRVQYKIGKKYGDKSGFSESITNIYLSQSEYELLRRADGLDVSKTRYRFAGGSIDIYAGEELPILFSVEFANETEALNYKPPDFVAKEVTHDPEFSGFALASAGARAAGAGNALEDPETLLGGDQAGDLKSDHDAS